MAYKAGKSEVGATSLSFHVYRTCGRIIFCPYSRRSKPLYMLRRVRQGITLIGPLTPAVDGRKSMLKWFRLLRTGIGARAAAGDTINIALW